MPVTVEPAGLAFSGRVIFGVRNLRTLQHGKQHSQGGPLFWILHFLQTAIFSFAVMAFNVHLRFECSEIV